MFVLTVKTPTEMIIDIDIEFQNVEANNLIKYMDCVRFSNLCKLYCRNYGAKWACPPFSKEYNQYCIGYEYLLIVKLSVDLGQFNYIKHNYLKVKAANSILKSRADKIIRSLSNVVNGKGISTGSCRLCKPCYIKRNLPCNRPESMISSFEALGINVEKLSVEIFKHELLWYKDKILPQYTTVIAGVLSNVNVTQDSIELNLKNMNL